MNVGMSENMEEEEDLPLPTFYEMFGHDIFIVKGKEKKKRKTYTCTSNTHTQQEQEEGGYQNELLDDKSTAG